MDRVVSLNSMEDVVHLISTLIPKAGDTIIISVSLAGTYVVRIN